MLRPYYFNSFSNGWLSGVGFVLNFFDLLEGINPATTLSKTANFFMKVSFYFSCCSSSGVLSVVVLTGGRK